MGVRDQISDVVRALLGVSAYQTPKGYGPELDDALVEQVREALGGQIQAPPTTRLRWYLADLESAQSGADAGNLQIAARLHRAMYRDGVLRGLARSRTSGLTRLPKRFYGDPEVSSVLRSQNGSRSVFDEMFPPAELALLDWDGINLGVGVAELVPVEGRDYPVMVRLDPEYLVYRWNENRWYFQSIAGLLPITPGDGRWILHMPGGRISPWNSGIWQALGRSWINKEHALLHRSNYSAKLANPARAAVAPSGATEAQRVGFLKRVIAWGVNTVFEMPPGWDVRLIESNGRGFEVFQEEISTSDTEIMVAISGQIVTTTGGSGFANAEVPESIREDLIQADGESLAYTINTQGLPQFLATRWGVDAITTKSTIVAWLAANAKDLVREANALVGAGNAIKALDESLAPHGYAVAVDQIAERFSVPIAQLARDATRGEGEERKISAVPDEMKEAA
jgi:hypothetical protein